MLMFLFFFFCLYLYPLYPHFLIFLHSGFEAESFSESCGFVLIVVHLYFVIWEEMGFGRIAGWLYESGIVSVSGISGPARSL